MNQNNENSTKAKYFSKTALIKWNKGDYAYKQSFIQEFIESIELLANEKSDFTNSGSPKRYKLETGDNKEKAYQRAIFLKGSSNFCGKEIKWIDMEVPVIPGGSPRRPSLDLLGKIDKQYVIVELKIKNGNDQTGECPLKGFGELLFYNYNLAKYNNQLKLHENALLENNSRYDYIHDIVGVNALSIFAANKYYWDYWRQDDELFDSIKEIKREIFIKKVSILFLQN